MAHGSAWYDKNHSNDPNALQGRNEDGQFTEDTIGGEENPVASKKTPPKSSSESVVRSFFKKSISDPIDEDDEEELFDIDEDDLIDMFSNWKNENNVFDDIDSMSRDDMIYEVRDLVKELSNDFELSPEMRGDASLGDPKLTLCNLRAMKKMHKEFPLDKKIKIGKEFDSSIAYTGVNFDYSNNTLDLNGIFFSLFPYLDSNMHKSTIETAQKKGDFMQSDGTENTLAYAFNHEYGHAVVTTLYLRDQNFLDEVETAMKNRPYARFDKTEFESLKDEINQLTLGFANKILDKVKFEVGHGTYLNEISNYGLSDSEEAIAELFASYYSGAPTESSKALVKILKEMY